MYTVALMMMMDHPPVWDMYSQIFLKTQESNQDNIKSKSKLDAFPRAAFSTAITQVAFELQV